MRLATIRDGHDERLALQVGDGWVTMGEVNRRFDTQWPADMQRLLEENKLEGLQHWCQTDGRPALAGLDQTALAPPPVRFAPLYRRPRKIWGIGLNYARHAADLSEKTPTGIPGSFMKPDTTIIGPGEPIHIPRLSHKTTAEGELGIVIGKTCKDVPEQNWRQVVAGFTTILDMTAEDILRQNVRYLALSKSFDTFFSFGPQLLTTDEVEAVAELKVATLINGRVHAENVVANMTFGPAFLVAFLSRAMTLLPGDIISTGTPGAAQVRQGDVVACRIDGFPMLENPVHDLKVD